jgi:hypothetical protein
MACPVSADIADNRSTDGIKPHFSAIFNGQNAKQDLAEQRHEETSLTDSSQREWSLVAVGCESRQLVGRMTLDSWK